MHSMHEPLPLAEVRAVRYIYGKTGGSGLVASTTSTDIVRQRDCRPARPLGLGQIDLAALDRGSHPATEGEVIFTRR